MVIWGVRVQAQVKYPRFAQISLGKQGLNEAPYLEIARHRVVPIIHVEQIKYSEYSGFWDIDTHKRWVDIGYFDKERV